MATYRTLQDQIAKLQEQAEAFRAKEVRDVIGRIREAIKTYGLTEADLGFGTVRKNRRGPTGQIKSAGLPPIYRDPKSGKTWSGRGRVPHWMAKARDRTRFLIEVQDGAGVGTSDSAAGVSSDQQSSKTLRGRGTKDSARRKTGPAGEGDVPQHDGSRSTDGHSGAPGLA